MGFSLSELPRLLPRAGSGADHAAARTAGVPSLPPSPAPLLWPRVLGSEQPRSKVVLGSSLGPPCHFLSAFRYLWVAPGLPALARRAPAQGTGSEPRECHVDVPSLPESQRARQAAPVLSAPASLKSGRILGPGPERQPTLDHPHCLHRRVTEELDAACPAHADTREPGVCCPPTSAPVPGSWAHRQKAPFLVSAASEWRSARPHSRD